MASYDIPLDASPKKALKLMPKSHIKFLKNLLDYIVCDEYIFAHAGVRSSRDIMKQDLDDLFWIREDFLDRPHDFEKTVIFGHTPYGDIFFDLPYKIGIDTGAIYGNCLTCVELINKTSFQVKASGENVLVKAFPA